MTITGGCRCGAVRYRIEAEPLFTRHCWCRDCQYISAGAGTVNVFFLSDAVKVEGTLADYASKAESCNPDAPTVLRRMRDAGVHPVGSAASLYRPRRSGARQAANGDLDLERALWAAFDPTITQEPKQPPPPKPKG